MARPVLLRWWKRYLDSLDKRPLLTKYPLHRLATGLFITGGGDLLAQAYEHPGVVDPLRARNLALYGILMTGGVGHYWYRGLDRLFGAEMTLVNSVKKTAFEQLSFGPLEVAFFIGWVHVLSGKTAELPDKYRHDLLPVVLANAAVWVPAQLINFYFVPEPLRVLYTCVLATLWNGFLSYASHNRISAREGSK